MASYIKWGKFAHITINKLANVKKNENVIILADTNTDMDLAQACLIEGLNVTENCQLLIIRRMPPSESSEFNKSIHNALVEADVIIGLCETRFVQTNACRIACDKGARIISTVPVGIEEYLISGIVDVDYEAMVQNGNLACKLWEETDLCKITSANGTDLSFRLRGRPAILGDGMATEPGEIDFFPGVQISIAPVEDTISGKIVVDGSISPGGIVSTPVEIVMEKGIIKEINGGSDANTWSSWLKSLNDPVVYQLCHFSIGLNPRARMSGNMIEDERVVASVTFGFGNQDKSFRGNVGTSRYHVDVVLTSPDIYLDGVLFASGNKLNEELGFKQLI